MTTTNNFIENENDLRTIQGLLAMGQQDNLLTIGRFDPDSTGEPIRAGIMLVTKSGKFLHFRNIPAPMGVDDYEGVLYAWEQAYITLGAIQKYTLNMKKSGNYKSPLTGLTKAQIVIRDMHHDICFDTRKFDTSLTSLTLFPKNKDLESVHKERDVRFLCAKHSRNMLRAFGINGYVKNVLNAYNQPKKELPQVTVEEVECVVIA